MATSVFSRLSRSSGNTAAQQRTSPALRRLVVAAGILTLLLGPAVSRAQSLPSIEDTVAGAEQLSGYFTLYWNDSTGQMYWEIGSLDAEFLYQVSMASGLGSNPVGIDRGQLSGTYVLSPKRIGPRLLLMQPNYRYARPVPTNWSGRQSKIHLPLQYSGGLTSSRRQRDASWLTPLISSYEMPGTLQARLPIVDKDTLRWMSVVAPFTLTTRRRFPKTSKSKPC